MTPEEITEFLDCNTWDYPRQMKLVELWNEHRGESSGLITINHVRTPCRLRQVLQSFRGFVKTEMTA